MTKTLIGVKAEETRSTEESLTLHIEIHEVCTVTTPLNTNFFCVFMEITLSTEVVMNTNGAINEGWLVGDIVITVGLMEGKSLIVKGDAGFNVLFSNGNTEGRENGIKEGLSEREVEGEQVGIIDGLALGAVLGITVGVKLGILLGNNVGNDVGAVLGT